MATKSAKARPWLKRGRLYVAGLPNPPSVHLRVSFKHEGEARGIAFGPVILFDVPVYEAWCKTHGSPVHGRDGATIYAIPFGAKPEGKIDLGWLSKPYAIAIAAHYGVELQEF